MIRTVLLAVAAMALPAPAMAASEMCTIAISTELFLEHGDPYERGIDEAERDRRMVHYEEWLDAYPGLQREIWERDAAQLLARESLHQARQLMGILLPDPAPVSSHICNADGPTPHRSDTLYPRLRDLLAEAPRIQRAMPALPSGEVIVVAASRRASDRFGYDYARIVQRCDAELRAVVSARVLRAAGASAISEVLGETARLGFGRSDPYLTFRQPLLRFDGNDRSLLRVNIARGPRMPAAPIRHDRLRAIQRQLSDQQQAMMSAYLADNPSAQSVVAAIENALDSRYDPAKPFSGYCPNTAAELRTLVESTLADRNLQSGPWIEELLGG